MFHFPGWVMSNFVDIILTWLYKRPGEEVQREKAHCSSQMGRLHRRGVHKPTQGLGIKQIK